MKKGVVFNIQRFSLHDGPGIRTNVFFKGCPLGCAWCANPESQDLRRGIRYDKTKCIRCGACVQECPNGSIAFGEDGITIDRKTCTACLACIESCPTHALHAEGTEYTVDELMAIVRKDKHYFDTSGGGVTLSGGEPLMQHAFVLEFLKALKRAGIHVVMETCGYSRHFEDVTPYVDLFYFDVKHPDDAKHREKTGKGNGLILENLEKAVRAGKHVVARIPVIPGWNDTKNEWPAYVELLREKGVHEAHLLPFHQMGQEKYRSLGVEYAYDNVPSIPKEALGEMQTYFADAGIETQIGG